MTELYSMENAVEFNWSSISNDLNPERRALLDKYLFGNGILDAGCGGGGYVSYLINKGFDCIGIDKFQDFIDFANEHGLKGKVSQGDITSLPFSDKTFECSFCFDVLEHVDDYASLAELERVTSKRILIAVPKVDIFFKKYGLTFLHYQDKSHLRTYDEVMLQKLIESIPHKKYTIENELAIPQNALFRDISKQVITDNYGKIFGFILNKLFKIAFRKNNFKPIYTGLVAVVDLV